MKVSGGSSTAKIALFVVAGLAVAVYGGYSLMEQSSALENSQPINVTIKSTGIEDVSQRRGVEYRPQASFSYSFEGENYSSDNVYPGGVSKQFNTDQAVEKVIQQYSNGEQTEAYINPGSPGEAFLIDQSSNTPYLMILIGLGLSTIATVSYIRN